MRIRKIERKLVITFELDLVGFLFNRWTLLIAFLAIAVTVSLLKGKNLNSIYYSIATCSLLYTAIISAFDYQSRRKEKRIDEAIRLVEKFDSEEIRRVRDFTRVIRDNRSQISDEELVEFLSPKNKCKLIEFLKQNGYEYDEKNKNINIERELVFLFNYWQQVYLAIKNNIADSYYICYNLKHVFNSQYENLKPWINKHIKINDPKQYTDLENFKNYI